MPDLDHTHDPSLRSWVDSANEPGCDFPIQNLPFGVFKPTVANNPPQIGVAIGRHVLDLHSCVQAKILGSISKEESCALSAGSLNQLMSLGAASRAAVRKAISEFLRVDQPQHHQILVSMEEVDLLTPAIIGDYTDFYASIHHATNVGSMFRPDNPLLPNYRNLPVGYHGRASSIVPSGTAIRRPMGQTKADDAEHPNFGPCRLLDYEMEMGFFVGPGNQMGQRIAMDKARESIFGMCILNDWSARDIQKWEYQPLGPFNAKNFATTISPWVVTLDALEPFRVAGEARGEDDPPVLDYLKPTDDMGYDINVEVYIASQQMREANTEPALISRGNFRDMYWTIAQMLAHHSSTGCNMNPGDLLASGTISGTAEDSRGCLLERTWRGKNPVTLPDGTERKFLQDGDEVIMKAYCESDGAVRIGFGECRGIIEPAK